jgi:hypothetical protein
MISLRHRLVEIDAAVRTVPNSPLPEEWKRDTASQTVQRTFTARALRPGKQEHHQPKDRKQYDHWPRRFVFHCAIAEDDNGQWDAQPRHKHGKEQKAESLFEIVADRHSRRCYPANDMRVTA